MEVKNTQDVKDLEERIRTRIQHYKLDQLLLGLKQSSSEPFRLARATLFTARFCTAGHHNMADSQALELKELLPLIHLVNTYLLLDPCTFEPPAASGLLSILLRIVGNQFPFATDLYRQHARSLILYIEIPHELKRVKEIAPFNFEEAFQRINGVSVREFIEVGLTAYAASVGNLGFTGGYFEKARQQRLNVPEDKKVIQSESDRGGPKNI